MIKGILILILSIIIVYLSLVAFQVLGNYAFLLMIVITLAVLLSRIDKPRFGGKNKANK